MNISDHISNQRHYLKVMLRCARMYHSQIEKPSIKNCHKLIDFRHCFYRCVSLYRSSVFNISKRMKAFFPWKNVQKISRNRSWLYASRECYQASVLFIAFIDSFAIHITALYTRSKAVVKHTHKTYYRRVLIQRGHCKGYFPTDVTHVKLKNKFT